MYQGLLRVVRGLVKLKGNTDGTLIGNNADALKVSLENVTMIVRTDVPSAARTVSGVSDTFSTVGMGLLNTNIVVSAVSGTSPKLDIELQFSDDGTNWSPTHSSKRFTSAPDNYRIQGVRSAGRYYRYIWTIAGTSPSFTFQVDSVLKNYLPLRTASQFRYADIDLSTNGAVSSNFTAGSCQNVSLQLVRAADGGNDAKIRIQVSNNNINWDDLTADIVVAPNTNQTQNFVNSAYRFYRVWVKDNANAGVRTLDLYWAGNGG